MQLPSPVLKSGSMKTAVSCVLRWSRFLGQLINLGSPTGTDLIIGKRKRYSAEYYAKVAMEAFLGKLTSLQLARKYGVHQTMIDDWKRRDIEELMASGQRFIERLWLSLKC